MGKDTVSPSAETITGGQLTKLADVIVAKGRKSDLPREASQQVIEAQGAEIAENTLADLRTRVEAHLRATEPHLLERQLFNPEQFLGKGWSIIERVGKRESGNLDAGRIVNKDYLEGESYINGKERLQRIKAVPEDVQLDEQDFMALWQEKGHKTLKWLYDTKGIKFLSFWGAILRNPDGGRNVLYLCRFGDGSWDWGCSWVDHDDGSASKILRPSSKVTRVLWT
ncbi:MAG: hypothetical protein ABIE68_04530 [bacterium]